jgi:hypothetical protein
MALNKNILKTEIKKITDKSFDQFEGFPETDPNVGIRWSLAINEYAKSILPVSITSEVAKEAFKTAMSGSSIPGVGLVAFPAAFTAYATALATGMSPAFVAVPPPIPIVLAPIFVLGLSGEIAEVCASAMSDVIDEWFKTGTATPSGGGNVVNWS